MSVSYVFVVVVVACMKFEKKLHSIDVVDAEEEVLCIYLLCIYLGAIVTISVNSQSKTWYEL